MIRPKAKPMLLMNQVPGLDECRNESEKFRHDVNMRPDEATPHNLRVTASSCAACWSMAHTPSPKSFGHKLTKSV